MAEFHQVDQAALDLVEGWSLDLIEHADYPHEPGRLYECLRCSVECFCTGQPGHTECVFCATLSEGTCVHEWQAGMMIVHEEDLESVASARLARGDAPIRCGKCDHPYYAIAVD